jgi:VIT1/CCC1 family predicted Fe2+/Mn2+ transporter
MSQPPGLSHQEQHFEGKETLRDIVIGMSDGLTVPFALAAGLSAAAVSSGIIVTAGLAEIAAGSIAMGLGGYLAAKTDHEHYLSEKEREIKETKELPEVEAEEVGEIFKSYGLTDEQVAPVLCHFKANPSKWVDFMMRFELGLERPDPKRGRNSALTIAASYIAGGLVPLLPYVFIRHVAVALQLSALLTLAALFIFGYVKGKYAGVHALRGAIQTVLIGGLAAAAAFAIARMIR